MLELKFSTDRRFENTPELRQKMGADQPLDTPSSANSPGPGSVSVITKPNHLIVRWEGLDLTNTSASTVDAWSNSVTNNIPGATEVRRSE